MVAETGMLTNFVRPFNLLRFGLEHGLRENVPHVRAWDTVYVENLDVKFGLTIRDTGSTHFVATHVRTRSSDAVSSPIVLLVLPRFFDAQQASQAVWLLDLFCG